MGTIFRQDIEVIDNGAPVFYCPYWPRAVPNGYGNLMFAGCTLSGGIYVPQCYIVTPVMHVMENARNAMHSAAEALNDMHMQGHSLDERSRN